MRHTFALCLVLPLLLYGCTPKPEPTLPKPADSPTGGGPYHPPIDDQTTYRWNNSGDNTGGSSQ